MLRKSTRRQLCPQTPGGQTGTRSDKPEPGRTNRNQVGQTGARPSWSAASLLDHHDRLRGQTRRKG
ncbi:MAG TPA: hypothetical protein PK156_05540, partial [Polyangium sp.]|nr:hypothetical protein [Polyangium sp.]